MEGIPRQRWATTTAIALVLGGFLSAASASAEPNDTAAGASGPIRNGVTYQGVIATENDFDWWVFYTGASTQLDIALLGLGREDCFGPVMDLYDSDGQVITGEDYPAERNETRHILRTVDAGTFYVKVGPYNIAPCIGSEALYHLWINSSPALLAGPPYIPPPAPPSESGSHGTSPGRGSYAAACRRTRQRISALSTRLRSANSRRQRNLLHAKLRRARNEARTYC